MTCSCKLTKKPRKQRKGHGPTPQPALAIIKETHVLAGAALNCPACGGQLTPMGTAAEEAELIGIEKRRIVLEKHLRMMYSCKCGSCLKTAAGPLKLISGGRYATSFTVHVAFLKYFAHVPLHRQVQMMKHEDCRVTTAALCDQLDALATALAATYEAIWKVVQSEEVLRADETPWAVMSNGHNDNERFYAWVVVGARYVAFRLLDTRSKDGAATILGSFAGKLMVDGLTSYPAAAKGKPGHQAPRFIVANCMAHARRPFIECEENAPTEAAHALGLIRDIYRVEKQATPETHARLRDTDSRKLVTELFDWAREARPGILPRSELGQALGYLLNQEIGLTRFLEDPRIPIDNNPCERALRGLVLGRKNHYGSRSRRGTEVAAMLYTLMESATGRPRGRREPGGALVGVSPRAYLRAVADMAIQNPGAVLTPGSFKATLPATPT